MTAPNIIFIEPGIVSVTADYDNHGVGAEIVDAEGAAGVRTLFDVSDALDLSLRLIGAIARIKGFGTSSDH